MANILFLPIQDYFYETYTGFLLREIKDFWRVTLLLSTLLYPTEVDCTEDFPKQHFQLDKQRDLFEAVESAIAKLGMDNVSFTIFSDFHFKLRGPSKNCVLNMLWTSIFIGGERHFLKLSF